MLTLFELDLHRENRGVDDLNLSALGRAYFDGTGRVSCSVLDEQNVCLRANNYRARIDGCDNSILAMNRSISTMDTTIYDQIYIGEQAGLFALFSSKCLEGTVGIVIVNHSQDNDFTVDDAVGFMSFDMSKAPGVALTLTQNRDVTCSSWINEIDRKNTTTVYEAVESKFREKIKKVELIYSSGTTTFMEVLLNEIKSRSNGHFYLTGLNAKRNRRYLVGMKYEQALGSIPYLGK